MNGLFCEEWTAELTFQFHSFGGAAGTTQTPDLATLIERDRVASEAFDAKDIKPMRGSSDRVMMLGGESATDEKEIRKNRADHPGFWAVPYSEHSSFTELTCFCLSVPGEPRIIPTVNVGSAKSREKMQVACSRSPSLCPIKSLTDLHRRRGIGMYGSNAGRPKSGSGRLWVSIWSTTARSTT